MAQNRKRVVQLWLPLVPAAAALLLLALVLWQVDGTVGRELEERSRQRVTQTATLFADRLSRLLERRTAELDMIAGMPALGVSPGDWREQINRLKHSSPSYVWIGATDAQGTVIVGSDGLLEGLSIAQRPVFLEGMSGPWFGSLHPPVALREPLAARQLPVPRELADLAMPYRDVQGEVGVLAAHLDAAYLDRLRTESIGPVLAQRGLQTELIDGQGERLLGQPTPLSPEVLVRVRELQPGVPTLFQGADGRDYVLARVGVRPTDNRLRVDWQVITSQPLDQVLAPVTELRYTLLWSGGALALLLGVVGFWLSRRLARPYGELLDAVAERVDPRAAQEPGELLRVIAEQLRRLPLAGTGSRTEQALAQVLQDASRLQAVFDHLPAPVYLVDMDMRVRYWNRAAERVFGWSSAEVRGRHIGEVFIDRETNPEREALRRDYLVSTGPWTFNANMVRRDGSDIWGEWRLTKLLGADGTAIGILAQVNDLTPEHLGEQRLREQGEELTALISAASDAVISVNLQGRITLFNPAAARIFQREPDGMLGQPLDALLPAGLWGRHLGYMQRFAESNATNRRMGIGRVQGMRADGAVLELEASISQATVRGEKRLTAILRDITERVSNEQALARYQLELSELTQRLLQQEQTTTRELAQTLHDQLGQTLGAIRLSYDSLATMTREQFPPRALERARKVGQQIDQAIAEVRQALVKLRPPLLESDGLAAALDNEIRQRAPEAEPVRLELVKVAGHAAQRWPDQVEYAAFMVAREAIANALQHAQASYVLVRLEGDDERLRLDIADDGIGLTEDMALGRPGHLGIVGMRERALAIGARLRARARREGGTRITLIWSTRSLGGADHPSDDREISTIF